MRDPERIDRILAKISDLWHANPDMRFGQLMSNFGWIKSPQIFTCEDDVMEAAIDVSLQKYVSPQAAWENLVRKTK